MSMLSPNPLACLVSGPRLTLPAHRVYNPPMSQNEGKSASRTAKDIEFVARITAGDEEAWAKFVDQHTDWALFKAKEWCVQHCPHCAGSYLCGLMSLSLQREGKTPNFSRAECDDGMDTYIWLFEQLKRKIVKYSGKNDCLLSTFVWTILNSRELYIDWLRWKYGRAF
ncbi:MAG: hypothetical protein HZB29_10900 [Nitrospinae bacterium]|nr:hypothetical protein [Nitrospinota bacterium]